MRRRNNYMGLFRCSNRLQDTAAANQADTRFVAEENSELLVHNIQKTLFSIFHVLFTGRVLQ